MSPSTRRPPLATIAACTAVVALTAVAAHGLSQLQLSLRPEVQNVLASKPIGNAECRQQLMGPIETTNCDYEDLENVNEDLFDNLHSLVTRPFFKYFHVDLFRECPFWTENSMCLSENCSVDNVNETDIPEKWRVAALSAIETPAAKLSLPGCYYRDTDFCFLDDEKDGYYVDLSLNPERFTGYKGDSARRVWSSIYNENCFGVSELSSGGSRLVKSEPALSTLDEHADGGQCLEKRVYYRVISGLHASISTHICWENMVDQTRGEWGPDLSCFINRVASNPERLQNIYFNTVLMLRALSRIKPYLSAYDMCSGDTSTDDLTKGELNTVLSLAERVGRFDEGLLFRGEHAVHKEEFKEHFRNVSRIMDCVGCDKCRLWGKVQITGVATALKILFELDESALSPTANPNLLQRSELVALINTLHRFSESLHAADFFRKEWAKMEANEEKPATKEGKPAAKGKADSSSATTDEGVNVSTPRVVPPADSPVPPTSAPNATLFDAVRDAVSERVAPIVKACEKGTAACVELVSNALGSLASLFQSSKYDGPGREL